MIMNAGKMKKDGECKDPSRGSPCSLWPQPETEKHESEQKTQIVIIISSVINSENRLQN